MRPELAGSRGESGTCNMWGLSENGVKLMRLLMFNYGIEIIKWEYPSMIEILMGYTMIFDTWDMSDMQWSSYECIMNVYGSTIMKKGFQT